jgi:hypothetical protein
MAIQVTIEKMRKHTHQITEVTFTHNNREHKVKIELRAGILGGSFSTDFTVELDGQELYHKTLYTFFLQRMKHVFVVEEIPCLVKYTWFSGIWFGHIYIDGEAVV